MTNIEKLVDFINENDEDGKLFWRFVAFLEMGLNCNDNSLKEKKVVVGQVTGVADTL